MTHTPARRLSARPPNTERAGTHCILTLDASTSLPNHELVVNFTARRHQGQNTHAPLAQPRCPAPHASGPPPTDAACVMATKPRPKRRVQRDALVEEPGSKQTSSPSTGPPICTRLNPGPIRRAHRAQSREREPSERPRSSGTREPRVQTVALTEQPSSVVVTFLIYAGTTRPKLEIAVPRQYSPLRVDPKPGTTSKVAAAKLGGGRIGVTRHTEYTLPKKEAAVVQPAHAKGT